MADEIKDQNVIRLERAETTGAWTAAIGPPDGRAVSVTHPSSPLEALCALVLALHSGGYLFDPSWKAPDAP